MIHELKIKKNYLDNLVSGIKKTEIRINDRDYQKGDILKFTDYEQLACADYFFSITHIHSGLGMEKGYIALSIERMDKL